MPLFRHVFSKKKNRCKEKEGKKGNNANDKKFELIFFNIFFSYYFYLFLNINVYFLAMKEERKNPHDIMVCLYIATYYLKKLATKERRKK